jgi:hypothetical protein
MIVQPDYRKTRHETKASDDKEKERVLNIRGVKGMSEKDRKNASKAVNNLK